MRLQFGSNTLDLAARELRHDAEVVELEPRTFAVLAHLVQHRHRVVPKEELLDEVWGDRFVGDSALTTQITHLRSALGDDGRAQRVIHPLRPLDPEAAVACFVAAARDAGASFDEVPPEVGDLCAVLSVVWCAYYRGTSTSWSARPTGCAS